jgi:hypothetical protein
MVAEMTGCTARSIDGRRAATGTGGKDTFPM